MNVKVLEADPAPTDRDVMLWDSIEKEWRVSHWHAANDDTEGWCPMSKRDVDTAFEDTDPRYHDCVIIPIMTAPTHWAEMPGDPEALAA